MSLRRFLESLINTIREKFNTLNVYDSKSLDLAVIRREILSTRLFIILLAISITILSGYTLISLQNKNETVDLPTQSVYENLQRRYPDSLQCPCGKLSISYKQFVNIIPSFHQVCSSQFVSQMWIDYVFITNSSSTWPIDVRTSLSTMWRLISALCQTATKTTIDTIDQFVNSPLINSMALSKELLEATVEAALEQKLQIASSTLVRPLTAIHKITQANELPTALSINYIAVTSAFGKGLLTVTVDDFDITVGMIANQYILNETTRYCSCRYNGTCPMPANLYLYNTWEKYGVYNLNTINANATLPGIVIDCLPLQMIFASSLECFYNQSCLDLLIFAYQKSINISILDKFKSTQFFPTTKIKFLIDKLFIEEINKEIIYNKYYLECAPIYCTYTYSRRFDVLFTLTTLLALFGGLTTALRLFTPFLVDLILFIKNHRSRINQAQPVENQSISARVKNITLKIKKSIIELNLFKKYSHDELRILRERITTWFFIILFIVSLCILIFYTFLTSRIVVEKIRSPTQEQYEYLLENFSTTLQCPCTILSVPYKDFIEISPIYHKICQSDFVQPWWYESLFLETSSDFSVEFIPTISSHFRTLATFCEIANLTAIEAIRQFSNTLFVNAQILSLNSFNSQINASINAFEEMTRVDFLYTMLLINKLLESNQYVSNTMGSTTIGKYYIPELEQSELGPIRFVSHTVARALNDELFCFCVFDSRCDVSILWYINDIPEDTYSDLEGISRGCFPMDSALKSSLLCWYMTSCINQLRLALEQAGLTIFHNVTPLNPQLSSRFPSNASTDLIFNEMMIERWNSSISYENFYQKCNPAYCTYSHSEKNDITFIVTTIIGFFGGLSVILRLISPFIVNIFFQCKNRKKPNIASETQIDEGEVHQDQSVNIPTPTVWSQFHKDLVQLNLFDTESNEVHMIQRERISSRLYLLILTICIVIVTIHIAFSKKITTDSITFPSQAEYEDLLTSHSYAVQCPCTRISISYEDFIGINTTFHQACSSEFTQNSWYYYLYGWQSWNEYERADIRGRGAIYFIFLTSLCKLSQTTVSNMITQFLTDTFVTAQAISESKFRLQIDDITHRFKTVTPQKFSDILTFMNDMTQSSGFISSYFLNWNWWMAYNSSVATLPTRSVTLNDNCSCGKQNECVQSGGVYGSYSDIEYFAIPGWNIGCSTVDTLLRSTLECFYDQSCIDSLMYYMTIVEKTYPITWNISSLDANKTSRFKTNTIIKEIVEKLFVEEWKINVSYSAFYNQCAPIYCSYTFEEKNDFSFILAQTLGLYGGLTVALRFIVPHLIQIAFEIRDRRHRNIIHPIA